MGLALVLFTAQTALAVPVYWTDWFSATTGASGSAEGKILLPGFSIAVNYSGDVTFAQLGTGTNYWTQGTPAPYTGNAVVDNAPTPAEMIALSRSNVVNTLTFSHPLNKPVMAIVSMGQPGLPVSYDFNQPFTVLSEGRGYWGDGSYTLAAGDILTGRELHAAIQLDGRVSSISWTESPGEYWHGITVGATAVPEPATMVLLGSGLFGIIGLRKKNKQ